MPIYDISPPLTEGVGVFPGDIPLTFKQSGGRPRDWPSAIETTLHIGAHVDAPCHCLKDAPSIGEVQLHPYLGPCQVMEVTISKGEEITVADLKEIKAPRVLFKTGTFPDFYQWREFAGLSPGLISRLHAQEVILVGIDTPSIDVVDLMGLPSHHQAFQSGMAVLEGISLQEVPEGCYMLTALPLPLLGVDGSPVRAVLQSLK